MEIENTFIEGLKLIRLNRFTDVRGSFLKVFNQDFFKANNLETNFQESYFSVSARNVIRGMHFQVSPFEHTKLVYVNKGAITDVILDIRKNSPSYGKFFSIEISEVNPIAIYIPAGCAHGFLSKQNNTMVTYMQTSVYNKDCDQGIRWDSFGMEWEGENHIVSERDRKFKAFKDIPDIFDI